MFTLDPQLEKDTCTVGHLPLSMVLLAKDANYPWCILVPKREGIREIHHLSIEDQTQFLQESAALARVMESVFQPFKMNVAALGNMVPQLHIHHIARFKDDAAWPKPIWGMVPAVSYKSEHRQQRLTHIRKALHAEEIGFYE